MADVLFEVEKIVDEPNDRQEFFIKWDGYPDSENTWEPLENLPEEMVEEYLNEIEREEEAEEAAKAANAAQPYMLKGKIGLHSSAQPYMLTLMGNFVH